MNKGFVVSYISTGDNSMIFSKPTSLNEVVINKSFGAWLKEKESYIISITSVFNLTHQDIHDYNKEIQGV